jgi:prophage DNA circulation protein
MSWIEKIQTPLTVTTGDGRKYTLLWKNATKVRDYNVALFDYPEINGTMVRRTTSKGRKYSFEFYFTGEDCLEVSDQFDQSNEDRTAWILEHPMYGTLIVQPVSISYDNSQYNVTRVTGEMIETLTQDNPKTTVNPADNIALDKENLDQAVVAAFDEEPTPEDIEDMTGFNSKFFKMLQKLLATVQQMNDAINKVKKAQAAINAAASLASTAIGALQNVINAPSLFIDGVKNRMNGLSSQFNSLRSGVAKLTGRSGKRIYESNATAIISAQALAAINPNEGDYQNKSDVLAIIGQITDNYNNYLADLDELQSPNGGSPDSYIPNASNLIALSNIVNNIVTSLFITASQSRQERTLILEDDTDIINLTHRLYGLDPSDNNITELRKNNSMGISEIIEIRKGRKIVYYR